MSRLARLAAVFALASAAAAAQTQPLVVTAQPDPGAFVRAVSARQGDAPTARWVDPVCPKVSGLADSYAALVVRRIREIAREAGASVASDGCKPNVIVTFTPDARTLLAAIDRADRTAFKQLPPAQREATLAGELPVSWWYRTEARDADGRPLRAEAAALSTGLPAMQLDETVTTTSSYASSLIGTKTQRALKGVGVVVDTNAIAGRPLRAVSSFVAMVAIAELKPGPDDARSILAAWTHPDDRIDDLTPLDRAYLRALYATPPNRGGDLQRATIAAQMRARLAG